MEMPVLDAACLTRLGLKEPARGEVCWFKGIPQGWIWIDAETGLGRLEVRDTQTILYLKFGTVTQIKWFLDCLK